MNREKLRFKGAASLAAVAVFAGSCTLIDGGAPEQESAQEQTLDAIPQPIPGQEPTVEATPDSDSETTDSTHEASTRGLLESEAASVPMSESEMSLINTAYIYMDRPADNSFGERYLSFASTDNEGRFSVELNLSIINEDSVSISLIFVDDEAEEVASISDLDGDGEADTVYGKSSVIHDITERLMSQNDYTYHPENTIGDAFNWATFIMAKKAIDRAIDVGSSKEETITI